MDIQAVCEVLEANATAREQVLREAYTWLRTPWHHMARIKGAGVDCGMLLAEVYAAAGVVEPLPPFEHYAQDWMLHRSEEQFTAWLEKYCHQVASPAAGDIALFRFGRTASHAAIVIEWPMVIHAYRHEGGVVVSDASKGRLTDRVAAFYSPWGTA
jgi:cell wall-associated NlpC family hydrolase